MMFTKLNIELHLEIDLSNILKNTIIWKYHYFFDETVIRYLKI